MFPFYLVQSGRRLVHDCFPEHVLDIPVSHEDVSSPGSHFSHFARVPKAVSPSFFSLAKLLSGSRLGSFSAGSGVDGKEGQQPFLGGGELVVEMEWRIVVRFLAPEGNAVKHF